MFLGEDRWVDVSIGWCVRAFVFFVCFPYNPHLIHSSTNNIKSSPKPPETTQNPPKPPKTILKLASGTVKKASMELGGNAPFIVFPSASLPAAAAALMAGKFRCSGQVGGRVGG